MTASPQRNPNLVLSRSQFLRGLGTFMALPALESLGFRAFAATKAPTAAPTRLAFLYVPNGVNVAKWFPTGSGKDYQFGPSMKVLEPYRNDFSIISGLCHDKGRSNGDGGGDHARATASFLTGVQARKTAGADISLGVSVDQIAAEQIGRYTKLPSLELSTDGQRSAGRCDSGYSCAYQFNLSWRNETMPMAPEMDPRLAFERVFGVGSNGTGPDAERRKVLQKSILDAVLADANRLQKRVSSQDKAKLEEYFSAVRDIEQRIERAEKMTKAMPAGTEVPNGIPQSYREHIEVMFDLLALSFQTDSTRVATFMLAHDGSNRSFPEVGVPENHHGISHHQRDPAKLEKIAKIDEFYLRQLGYFLSKMKSIKEGSGSLLDNSMIVWGGGLSDPDRHDHSNLPIILAGGGGGSLHPGRHIALNPVEETPMTNLYLGLLERAGVKAERVGDSTGVLNDI